LLVGIHAGAGPRVAGFGGNSYLLALEGLVAWLAARAAPRPEPS